MDSKGIIYTKKKIGRLNIFNTKNKLDNIKSGYLYEKYLIIFKQKYL